MGIKTPEQFIESLRDGRTVYLNGERVEDVTTHPMLKTCVATAAMDYRMAEMPEYHDLCIVEDKKLKEPISRYFHWPRNGDDLLKKHEMMLQACRLNSAVTPFAREMIDAFNAVLITVNTMGKKEYIERAEAYHTYLKKNDLAICGAITDVKGDRSLRPSDPKQQHKDYYLRVVDRGRDGIVVRGSKAHITASPYVNEMIVLPCRNMTEADADYAVAFALPVNTKGVIHIAHPFRGAESTADFPVPLTIPAHTDCMIVFDDVFVPWERVFMCGEWQYAQTVVYNFAYLHRHTATTYHIPMVEVMVGLAATIADYHGIEKSALIREKITDLIIYLNTMKSLARASCIDYVMHGGMAIPNPVTSNLAKYYYANEYHNASKIMEDLAGGLLTTAPSYRDWNNPETRKFMDKYLGGRSGVSAEDRLRILQLMRVYPYLGLESDVLNIHAEGSLMAERLTIYAESRKEIEEYKKTAKYVAGVGKPAWEDYKKQCDTLCNLDRRVEGGQ
jgi:4-hydroxybutyryl-CoA dehydratase/vinylacetyl-CoA-Delta-isomerase